MTINCLTHGKQGGPVCQACRILANGEPVDVVNHPPHYTSSPAKCRKCDAPIECIHITEHMGFNLGNTVKYVWRCDLKKDAIEDLEKAVVYLTFEIAKRKRERRA